MTDRVCNAGTRFSNTERLLAIASSQTCHTQHAVTMRRHPEAHCLGVKHDLWLNSLSHRVPTAKKWRATPGDPMEYRMARSSVGSIDTVQYSRFRPCAALAAAFGITSTR